MTFHSTIITAPQIAIRLATIDDRQMLEELKELSLERLLDPCLSTEQRRIMRRIAPFDMWLIEDRTYYVAEVDGKLAASGGWSRRAALYRSADNDEQADRVLDPLSDAAVIRAMYTHPDFARRGLGALILSTALTAARFAGFKRAQLLATVTGEKFYKVNGWTTDEKVFVGPAEYPCVPGFRMSRDL